MALVFWQSMPFPVRHPKSPGFPNNPNNPNPNTQTPSKNHAMFQKDNNNKNKDLGRMPPTTKPKQNEARDLLLKSVVV